MQYLMKLKMADLIMQSPTYTSPKSKIKPYNVVDLSTRTVLNDDEIYSCLQRATEKEFLKHIGDYDYFKDQVAKPNGDPPNSMKLPPKLGRCSSSVPEHLDQISGGEKTSTVKFKSTGYDNVPVTRPRANTAPSMVLNEVIKKPFVKQRRPSKLTQPASPGCAKRKVQSKLQRDREAKQQSALPRSSAVMNGTKHLSIGRTLSEQKYGGTVLISEKTEALYVKPNERVEAATSSYSTTVGGSFHKQIPLQRQYGGSRLPAPKISSSLTAIPTTIAQTDAKQSNNASKLKPPEHKSGLSSKPAKTIGQINYRSSVHRVSHRSSDASSSESSSESGSTRTTPVFGFSKTSASPQSDIVSGTTRQSGIPSKMAYVGRSASALELKRTPSLSREDTSENLKYRKISGGSAAASSTRSTNKSLTNGNAIVSDEKSKMKVSHTRKASAESLDSSFRSKLKLPAQSGKQDRSIPVTTSQMNNQSNKSSDKSKISKPSFLPKAPSKKAKQINNEVANDPEVDDKNENASGKVNLIGTEKQEYIKTPETPRRMIINSKSPNVSKKGSDTKFVPRSRSGTTVESDKKHDYPKKYSDLTAVNNHVSEEDKQRYDKNERSSLRHPVVGKLPQGLEKKQFSDLPSVVEGKRNKTLGDYSTPKLRSSQNSLNELEKPNEAYDENSSKESIDKTELKSKANFSDQSHKHKINIPASDDTDEECNDSLSYSYEHPRYNKTSHSFTENKIITKTDTEPTLEKVKRMESYDIPDASITNKKILEDYQFRVEEIQKQKIDPFNGLRLDTYRKDNVFDKNSSCNDRDRAVKNNQLHISSTSPFRRIHPKVNIPPPKLTSDDDFALTKDLTRTPSSDCEDLYLTNRLPEMADLRRKVREQALKAWKGNAIKSVNLDALANDVFISPTDENKEIPEDAEEEFITDTDSATHQRRLSDGNLEATLQDNMYHLGTMTLGRDKKKTSKIKKFFKKLSSKKDGKIESDLTSDYFSSSDGLSRTSTGSTSSANIKLHRRSDGNLSIHSIQDIHYVHTPTSKRRNFVSLSFMKKSRKRSSTSYITYMTNRKSTSDLRPSETVRALCSPDLARRNQFVQLNRTQRRGSDPSVYHISLPPKTKRTSNSISSSTNSPPYNLVGRRQMRSNTSSISSYDNDEADYANYPLSKMNIKPPQKPQRRSKIGSCSESYSTNTTEAFSNSFTNELKNLADGKTTDKLEHSRLSCTSSDASSVVSSDCGPPASETHGRSESSLRRTPLRSSIDSFNKLLEVHKQTIDKIAFEMSKIHCSCKSIQDFTWDDFECNSEIIQLGLNRYIVQPVTDRKEKKNYTAWLRLNQRRSPISKPSTTRDINYTKSSLHRNCLHICHTIEQKYASPIQDCIPKAIQIEYVYISPQTPKMSLSKYTSVTLEKHARYPEMFERETAMILLQIVKSIEHYYRNDVILNSVDSDNIFILNSGDDSVTLSPRRGPNKCPTIVLATLEGLGESFENNEEGPLKNICYQLAFLLLDLLHSPFHDELREAADITMLLETLPDLTIKSTYSRYLQYVINLLLGSECHRTKTLQELKVILGVILFGPAEICDHAEDDAVILINKWHNRRCVDMVTHILKEAPLIMYYASGGNISGDTDNLKSIDQEIILECEFLSEVAPIEIYRISKLINR